MRRISILVLAVTFLWLLEGRTVWAQKYDDKEQAELAKALKDAKVSLEKGLSASESQGKPISGKFEVEDGKLQLSVYTMKGGYDVDVGTGDVRPAQPSFSEVIVDYSTGKISKVIPIQGGEDLAAARSQRQAMAQAARSLESATAHAVTGNKGYRAVSAMPALENGHPVAKVLLVRTSR